MRGLGAFGCVIPGVPPGGTGRRVEARREGPRGFLLHVGQHVLIGGHGEAGCRVSESFAYDFDWDAGLEPQGRVRVAEVVEPDAGERGAGDKFLERVGDDVWMVGTRVRGQAARPRLRLHVDSVVFVIQDWEGV